MAIYNIWMVLEIGITFLTLSIGHVALTIYQLALTLCMVSFDPWGLFISIMTLTFF